MSCALGFMKFIDVVTLLLGAALFGVSIYFAVTYNSFATLVPFSTLYISLGVGAGLLLVGCFGCAATHSAKFGHKKILCCYLFFVILLCVLQVVSTVLISNFLGVINLTEQTTSSQITDAENLFLSNAILSVYTACCTGCPENANPPCNNALPFFSNVTAAPCQNFTCSAVPNCQSSSPDDCYVSDIDGEPVNTLYPPVAIEEPICDFFATVAKNDDKFIVGAASQKMCGEGNPGKFMDSMLAFFGRYTAGILAGLGVLAGLQALNVLAAAYVLVCYVPPEFK